MARKTGGLWTGMISELRSMSGAIAADSATLTDANIPPASGVDCSGLDTVLIGIDVTGGTNPTMTIEALFYDADAADGFRWKRMLLGAPPGVTATALANETTTALAYTASTVNFCELRVFGHSKVFFRVTSVANSGSTTASKILGMPGRVRGDRSLSRKLPA